MIHIILGTRAQLIKMAPIMKELQEQKIDYNFIFLAEHKETIDSILDMFKIKKPDYVLGNLNKDIINVKIMIFWFFKVLFSAILNKKKIFRRDKGGIVLVHGDAPPAFLGALIAKISGFNVGHIESGLRSFNLFNPFPEEITRLLTFHFSNYYFCPGKLALNNLKRYSGVKINTIENTLSDSLNLAIKNQDKIKVDIPKQKYCIFTIHRFENIFNKKQFNKILEIIEEFSSKVKILFILHPPTKKQLEKFEFMERISQNRNIELRSRYDYFKFIKLVNKAEFIVSDGGSNQEECYYLGKPCLLLRNHTERDEGIDRNVILSKFNKTIIKNFIYNYKIYQNKKIERKASPSKIIVNSLKKFK